MNKLTILILLLIISPILAHSAFPVENNITEIIIDPQENQTWSIASMISGILSLPIFIFGFFLIINDQGDSMLPITIILSSFLLGLIGFFGSIYSLKNKKGRRRSIVGILASIIPMSFLVTAIGQYIDSSNEF